MMPVSLFIYPLPLSPRLRPPCCAPTCPSPAAAAPAEGQPLPFLSGIDSPGPVAWGQTEGRRRCEGLWSCLGGYRLQQDAGVACLRETCGDPCTSSPFPA